MKEWEGYREARVCIPDTGCWNESIDYRRYQNILAWGWTVTFLDEEEKKIPWLWILLIIGVIIVIWLVIKK